jgi:RpiR family carbohydrate utilization transcriptional regulator
MSVLLQIRSRYLGMNPAFRKVADYFLNNRFTECVEMSEVTRATGVSKATVSRFAHWMGYGGYKGFQMDLIRANLVSDESPEGGGTALFGYRDVTMRDSAQELCRKIFLSNIKALEDTLALIDVPVLEEMVRHLAKGGIFYIFASGRSFVAGDSLRKRLMRLDIPCACYNDPHEQALASTLIRPEHLVLGISAFGRSSSTLRAMVVGLTSHRGTPIERMATHMLYTVSSDPIFHSAEPSCTTVTHIALLDCVYMMLVMRDPKPARRLLEEGAEAMEGERMQR